MLPRPLTRKKDAVGQYYQEYCVIFDQLRALKLQSYPLEQISELCLSKDLTAIYKVLKGEHNHRNNERSHPHILPTIFFFLEDSNYQ